MEDLGRRILVGVGALLAVAVLGAPAVAGRLSAGVPVDCQTAKALARVPARPVWLLSPKPARMTLAVNVDALPLFVNGIGWRSGSSYFWLVRVPGGANLGDTAAKVAARPTSAGIGARAEVLRLGGEDRRVRRLPRLAATDRVAQRLLVGAARRSRGPGA